jgi:hypothetical protein
MSEPHVCAPMPHSHSRGEADRIGVVAATRRRPATVGTRLGGQAACEACAGYASGEMPAARSSLASRWRPARMRDLTVPKGMSSSGEGPPSPRGRTGWVSPATAHRFGPATRSLRGPPVLLTSAESGASRPPGVLRSACCAVVFRQELRQRQSDGHRHHIHRYRRPVTSRSRQVHRPASQRRPPAPAWPSRRWTTAGEAARV